MWNTIHDLKKDTVFLRFNPDAYTNSKGERIKGCFKQDEGVDLSVRMQHVTCSTCAFSCRNNIITT